MSRDWRKKLVRKLRVWAADRFPLTFPIRVYVRPASRMANHLGFFEYDNDTDRGVICISDGCDREATTDTFIEEWAHARTTYLIDMEDHSDDPWHHAGFWAEYGRIQCAAREVAW